MKPSQKYTFSQILGKVEYVFLKIILFLEGNTAKIENFQGGP